MIRRVGLLRKHPDLDSEAFFRHWIEHHAELARQVEGLRGYRINRIVGASGDASWDGLGELWFDDAAAAETGLSGSSALAREIDADLRRFVGERLTFYTEEHVIIPPPT
jgi:uncharacterized protein (TIGR02118 family)